MTSEHSPRTSRRLILTVSVIIMLVLLWAFLPTPDRDTMRASLRVSGITLAGISFASLIFSFWRNHTGGIVHSYLCMFYSVATALFSYDTSQSIPYAVQVLGSIPYLVVAIFWAYQARQIGALVGSALLLVGAIVFIVAVLASDGTVRNTPIIIVSTLLTVWPFSVYDHVEKLTRTDSTRAT